LADTLQTGECSVKGNLHARQFSGVRSEIRAAL